jgi:hypothetical protein
MAIARSGGYYCLGARHRRSGGPVTALQFIIVCNGDWVIGGGVVGLRCSIRARKINIARGLW